MGPREGSSVMGDPSRLAAIAASRLLQATRHLAVNIRQHKTNTLQPWKGTIGFEVFRTAVFEV